mmetsp:Transcript_19800/g.49082  ORF Transcript_19800/g.49082 Transcript_19800/m.49082 type:complete len:361 (-) Transcript_19800:1632-2714(-)
MVAERPPLVSEKGIRRDTTAHGWELMYVSISSVMTLSCVLRTIVSRDSAVAYPAANAATMLAMLTVNEAARRARRSVPKLARRPTRASISVARKVTCAAEGATPWMIVDSESIDSVTEVKPRAMLSVSTVEPWCSSSEAMDFACAARTAARDASSAALDVCSADSCSRVRSSAVGFWRSRRRPAAAAAAPAMLPMAMVPWHLSHTHISPAVALHPRPSARASSSPHWHTFSQRSASYASGATNVHVPAYPPAPRASMLHSLYPRTPPPKRPSAESSVKASRPCAGVASRIVATSSRRRVMSGTRPALSVASTTAEVSLVNTPDWIRSTSISINVSIDVRTCRRVSSVAPVSTYFAGLMTI